MIKTEMLRVFVAVARAGNLATAAEALGRAPSAVSMTLKQLEEHLGRPLFETGRKSRLTPLGAFVLELAEREISHVDRTRAALADFANARIGDARIACVPSFSVALLPGLVAGFARQSPGVRLDIRDLDSGAILRELERERIDIGIVSSAQATPKLHRARLAADTFGLFLRDDHPLAARDRVRWDEVAELPLIANALCDRLDVPGLHAALSAARLRARNTTTLLAFVAAGLGITVLPALVHRDAPGGVVFRPLVEPEITRTIDMLWRAGDTPSPAAAAFIRFTTDWIAREVGAREVGGAAQPARGALLAAPASPRA